MPAQRIALFSCIVLAVLISGCGGGSSGNSATPLAIQSGNWSISGTSTAGNGSFVLGGSLSQTGNNISGIMHFFSANVSCFNPEDDIPFSGTITGQKVTLTSPSVAGEMLTVNATGSSMALSGSYSIIPSPGATTCIGAVTDQGMFTGTLVPSISGTWHGSLVSILTPGTPIGVTANITQSSTPDAHGFFPVTGTLTFTGSPCFTSGDIQSTVLPSNLAGSQLALTIVTNDTPTAGLTSLSAALDVPSAGNSMTGSYVVRQGNCAVDAGSAHVTKQ
ncbi:MAG TPA: hypothetical protein VFI72_09955 [Candidatus Angelobacter sp.]|nr:hypothetical protein [Candidatus Angelobacter sp.]